MIASVTLSVLVAHALNRSDASDAVRARSGNWLDAMFARETRPITTFDTAGPSALIACCTFVKNGTSAESDTAPFRSFASRCATAPSASETPSRPDLICGSVRSRREFSGAGSIASKKCCDRDVFSVAPKSSTLCFSPRNCSLETPEMLFNSVNAALIV